MGNLADIDPIKELTKRHGIYLVEDAAEAMGSYYKGRHAGTFGDFLDFFHFMEQKP